MNIGIVQFDIDWENKKKNQEMVHELVDTSESGSNIDWIIFPEMTLTGFSMNTRITELAKGDGHIFGDIAKQYQAYVTYGGVLNGKNCSITLDKNGDVINEYSKLHLFSYAGEDQHYTPGKKQTSFSISGMRITPMICYDLRFAYLYWDKALETDVYVVIASWPASRILHWRTLLQARAIENQAYVIGVNRIGSDPKNSYCGNSLVIDPMGNIVLDCDDREGLFIANIDRDLVTETRSKFPFQKDRKKIDIS